jgi:hypothetical protein
MVAATIFNLEYMNVKIVSSVLHSGIDCWRSLASGHAVTPIVSGISMTVDAVEATLVDDVAEAAGRGARLSFLDVGEEGNRKPV